MRSLPKPTIDAGETFALCISKVRRPILKFRLKALRTVVEDAASIYDDKGVLNCLHEIAQTGDVGKVSKRELQKVYTNRMAKEGAPGYGIYNTILISPPQRRCPLCSQRDASTLDHYLPESKYSTLVVSPSNLVPSCKDCNFNKRAAFPNSVEFQTFHPYFDNFDDETWLVGEVVKGDPLGFLFEVCEPDHWDKVKRARAKHHFSILKLGDLYSEHAVSELVGIKLRLKEQFELGGSDAVRQDLDGTARSTRVVRPNSWQTALYTACAADSWFCEGGFESIPEEEKIIR